MKESLHKIIFSGIFAACLLAAFSACKYEGDVINVIKDAEEESLDFVSESIPLYRLSNSPTELLYARFYKGQHYLPYVAARYFLQTIDNYTFSKTGYSEGKYTYEYSFKGKSYPLIIDVKNDVIICPEWAGYIDGNLNPEEEDVAEKMLRVLQSYSGQKIQTFDLKKYGMEIYGGCDDAYVPLCVLNQIFYTRKYKEVFYNGQGVYVFDYEKDFVYESFNKSSWYMKSDSSVCERPKELVELNYNMLCFTHDYFYGQPGYHGFTDDGNGYPDLAAARAADALNFDAMLSTYAPDVKSQLKSSSYFDYMKGMVKLFDYVYGDGHSTSMPMLKFLPNFTAEEKNELKKAYSDFRTVKNKKRSERNAELTEARKNAAGRVDSDNKPIPFYRFSDGKTAVITFDSFNFDADSWKKYYDSSHVGVKPNPDDFEGWGLKFPADVNGVFYSSFYKLTHDDDCSGIERVIIDVSLNSGGQDIVLMNLLTYLIDDAEFLNYDVHNNSSYRYYISSDLNLDGKIDNNDLTYHKVLKQKYKFAILASRRSFSCGNGFPAFCADAGIPVIGERSGGGACVVHIGCTADGFPYQFSGSRRLSHKSDWSTVENGTPPSAGAELSAAADFYDEAKLLEILNQLFK